MEKGRGTCARVLPDERPIRVLDLKRVAAPELVGHEDVLDIVQVPRGVVSTTLLARVAAMRWSAP